MTNEDGRFIDVICFSNPHAHAKEFRRKLSTVCERADKNFPQLCANRKSRQNIRV